MDRSESSSTDSVPLSVKSPEWKLLIWETFEMSLPGEVDAKLIEYHWHWLMYPCLDFFGPEQVYAIGLGVLGYPPTWVDTKQEADSVEAALVKNLNGE
mgnify:FL=1